MQMMVRQRALGGGKRGKKPEAATPPVVVTTTLTAEWPLKAADAEEMLLLVGALEAKIRKADLGGSSEPTSLSPEEQELMEEAEMNNYSDEEQPKPGQPRFLFVKKISEKEQADALAQAFEQAKAEAAKLAKAAALNLGSLKHLSSSLSASDQMQQYSAAMYQYSRYGRSMQPDPNVADLRNEAIGPQPDEVTYTVTISASFEAK
jgi:hypothetical protein